MTVLSSLRDQDCGTEWTLTLGMPQTTQYLKANLKPSYSESAMLTYFMLFNQFFNCKQSFLHFKVKFVKRTWNDGCQFY